MLSKEETKLAPSEEMGVQEMADFLCSKCGNNLAVSHGGNAQTMQGLVQCGGCSAWTPFKERNNIFQVVAEAAMPIRVCPKCKAKAAFRRRWDWPPDGDEISALDSCSACGFVAYFKSSDRQGQNVIDQYPPIDLDVDEELPEELKRSLGEAVGTYAGGYWNASAQACGRALQDGMALLKPVDIEQKAWSHTDLKKQIDRLVTDNKLPPSIGEWAQDERIVRNLASHGGDQNDFWADEQDATQMLEFAKWIFRYMFILPKQLELRRKRLAEAAAKNIASQSGKGSNAP